MSSDGENNGIIDDCDDSKQEDSRGHRQDDGVKDSSNDGSEVHCDGDDKEKKSECENFRIFLPLRF